MQFLSINLSNVQKGICGIEQVGWIEWSVIVYLLSSILQIVPRSATTPMMPLLDPLCSPSVSSQRVEAAEPSLFSILSIISSLVKKQSIKFKGEGSA